MRDGADVGEFGGDVSLDTGAYLKDFTEHAHGVLAHFRAGEQFARFFIKIKTGLNALGIEGHADVIVGQQQTAVGVRGAAAFIQKPSGRAGGIGMEQLKKFLFEAPEVQKRTIADVERAKGNDGAEKGQVGIGIGGALKGRQCELLLQRGKLDREPVQSFGHVAE